MLDLETCAMVSAIYYDSAKGDVELSPHIYQKRLALNLMTMFCYGTRFASIKDPLLGQILSDANTIARYVLLLLSEFNGRSKLIKAKVSDRQKPIHKTLFHI